MFERAMIIAGGKKWRHQYAATRVHNRTTAWTAKVSRLKRQQHGWLVGDAAPIVRRSEESTPCHGYEARA